MSSQAENTIGCPACGKKYRWRNELAGRKVRCTCSQIMLMPQQTATGDELIDHTWLHEQSVGSGNSGGSGEYELKTGTAIHTIERASDHVGSYDLSDSSPKAAQAKCPACNQSVTHGAVLCIKCGFNIAEGKRMHTAVVNDDLPDLPAVSQPVAAPDLTGSIYAAAQALSGHRAVISDDGEVMREYRFQEFYLPLILLGLGAVFTFWKSAAFADASLGNWFLVGAFDFIFQLVVMLPMMIVAMILACKIGDISFGAAHTAVLKLAAIAVGPMGLAELILAFISSVTFGLGTIFFYVGIYIVCVCPFLAKLFDLDIFETTLTFIILMLIRFVFSSIIVFMLISFVL